MAHGRVTRVLQYSRRHAQRIARQRMRTGGPSLVEAIPDRYPATLLGRLLLPLLVLAKTRIVRRASRPYGSQDD